MALTSKQRVFVVEYLKCWNASEAARRAGYSERTAAVIGSENLRKPNISEEIERRKAELMMSADEALIRLTEHARGDMGDFAHIESDSGLANHPQSRIVKKFKKRVTYNNKNDTETVYTELELYDAQAALRDIGKHHGLFSDKIEHSGTVKIEDDLTDEQRAARIVKLIEAVQARGDNGGD